METTSKFILPGILLLLALAFGFWLHILGKPYNGLLFNVHKLVALGAVVFAVIQTYNLLKGVDVPLVVVALAAVCVLCVVALFATGAFMSIGNLPNVPLLTMHRIALIVLPLSAATLMYLMVSKGQP